MTENHLRLPFRHGLWRYVDNGSLCNFFAFAFLFCNVYAGSHGSCLSLPWESVGCSGRLLHVNMDGQMPALSTLQLLFQVHATTGCGEQGFPSAQPYLSHTPVS